MLFFLYFITRLPPSSTLFPYTTLFRSVVARARPRQGVGGLDAFLVDVRRPPHDLLHGGRLERTVLAVPGGPARTVRVHQALHDAVAVGGAVPRLAQAVEVVLGPVERVRGLLGLLERGRQLDLLLLELVAPYVPEGRHDVPGNRPRLAVDDRHRRHVRGWLAHLALDLLREAAEVEQLAHPGEACRRARLELADVGRVLVLDGRHVLRLHVLEREVLDGDGAAVLGRPALRARLDGLVGGLDVGLEDPEPQAGGLLLGRRLTRAQRQRRARSDQETTPTHAQVCHGPLPCAREYRRRPRWCQPGPRVGSDVDPGRSDVELVCGVVAGPGDPRGDQDL